MSVDLFLKIPEIPGECSKDKHKGEIDIHTFQFGAHQTGSFAKGGVGGGAGKAEFTDVSITKDVDKASPKLFQACAAGTHFKEMTITSQKAGDTPLVYYVITLGDVIISSLNNSGAGGADTIHESLTMNCAQIQFKYTEQNEKGGAGATSEAGYHVGENKKI